MKKPITTIVTIPDMIELYEPDVDALGYVSTNTMTEKVRIKLSDETKL